MSVEQYQRSVDNLDREIASLEKKKAAIDKKAADEALKASKVTISKNASDSTRKTKLNEIDRHNNASIKASQESAKIQKQISEKRARRNSEYDKLKKEQAKAQKKEQAEHQRMINNLQQDYESQIAALQQTIQRQAVQTVKKSIEQSESDNEPEYDVFISHASEDKESFVNEFVDELQKLGINVWYDVLMIAWGDSLRAKIDEGLSKSKFGVVVLSQNYIAKKKFWTKAEFDGLFQREETGKTILPIWHNITKKQVMEYSPMVAAKLALNTSDYTPAEIAEKLAEMLRKNTEETDNG